MRSRIWTDSSIHSLRTPTSRGFSSREILCVSQTSKERSPFYRSARVSSTTSCSGSGVHYWRVQVSACSCTYVGTLVLLGFLERSRSSSLTWSAEWRELVTSLHYQWRSMSTTVGSLGRVLNRWMPRCWLFTSGPGMSVELCSRQSRTGWRLNDNS